jgi:hypothetical protein
MLPRRISTPGGPVPEARICPSILVADLLRLGELVRAAEQGGAARRTCGASPPLALEYA